ncbi:MAG: cupin domain-containing protein [Nitrososphaeria archaeon]
MGNESPKSKVFNSRDLNYQEESIVSRTVIDKDCGTVTVFAFDKGQRLSEHTVPYDAFVLILDGKAEIKILKKQYMLEEGDMIILPANEPHEVRALESFKMILVMIRS